MDTQLILFITVQLINVIVSTIKSIVTVSGSKLTASVINAISYTIAAVIIKFVAEQTFAVAIVVTLITNIIGVYIGKWIMEKIKKDKLWTIVATIKPEDKSSLEKELKRRGVKFTLVPAFNDRVVVNIFSYTRAESELIKEILDTDKIKYFISESVGTL